MGVLGPHLPQCRLGQGLAPYRVAPRSTQPFVHKRHGPKIGGGAVPLWGRGAGSPSNTMWPGPRPTSPTSVPSFILMHPTVWPQYTNVTDRQTDSIGRTVLQTVAQNSTNRPTDRPLLHAAGPFARLGASSSHTPISEQVTITCRVAGVRWELTVCRVVHTVCVNWPAGSCLVCHDIRVSVESVRRS